MLGLRYQFMLETAENYGIKEEWMDEIAADGMRDAQRGGNVIVMGSFWFGNILVSDGPLRIYIIDWERARCARPEFDVANLACQVHRLMYEHPAAAGSLELMPSFMNSYSAHFELDEVQLGLSGGRDVMSYGGMMSCLQHDEKEAIAKAGLRLLKAARDKDIEEIRTHPVVRDMYRRLPLSTR